MKYLRLLILSLFIHGVIYYLINFAPPPVAPPTSYVEVEIPDTSQQKNKNSKTYKMLDLANDVKSQDNMQDDLKNVVLADKRVRVKQETNARIKANETVNRKLSLQQLTNTFHDQIKSTEHKKTPQIQDMGGDVIMANKKTQPKSSDPKPLILPGMSTSRNSVLDDIKIGDFTALNADQHLFYTFHRRINETVRPRWESKVYSLLSELTQQGYGKKLGSKDWTTDVEIILDGNGYFQRSVVDRASGIQGLDYAFLQAFKESSPFLNPPAEMKERDGNIHLKYRVTVRWAPDAPVQ